MKNLILFFFKLGVSGFGGSIAMIGIMEQHFVHEEKSISEEKFKRFVAAAKLFPGTVSTLIAIRIGFEKRGRLGGFIAGACQILPSFLMILVLGHFLNGAKESSHPLFEKAFIGLQLGGLALSIMAAYRFTRPSFTRHAILYVLASAILTFYFPKDEIFFLLACGLISMTIHRFRHHLLEASSLVLSALFFESFKASLFTYGTGMAMMPVLKNVYIDRYHWVSPADFLTALSIGQITPGPMVVFNSYLANQVAGFSGASLATIGIFLPSFIFGLWLMPLFEKPLLNNPSLKVFFAGMLPAVGGAILGSVVRLCFMALQDSNQAIHWDYFIMLAVLTTLVLKTHFHPIVTIVIGAIIAMTCL